ncbi:lysophospholipid acyltransferase family protein [Pseudomonas sp. NW5]|uniref:lysophospholipid acyltransferase family protein n=1 Tax=Pseudomonas sp. NW5 TaxID=2934934 RepID=UPI0020205F44|nr:lysophospholipid acyltransferase family protein [Pseudomonas sp. NW5]MCL7461552.1 1-acyl-sn-glycerol-3-phosphate acyltransferase [Pseudomonas sp. NW5]
MRRLRLLVRLPRLALVLAEGALYAGVISLFARLAPFSLARRQRLTCRFMRHLQAALPFKVQIHGALPTQPCLWLANHVSWTDIAVLGALQPLSFLAKQEVADWPLLGWLARQAGTLFIARGAGQSRELSAQLAQQIGAGRPLAIFPEGTSSDGRTVRRFHPRLLAAVAEAGLVVQPVALRYRRAGQLDTLAPFIDDDALPQHLLRLLAAERACVEIHLLAPIDSAGLGRSALAQYAEQMIRQTVEETGNGLFLPGERC